MVTLGYNCIGSSSFATAPAPASALAPACLVAGTAGVGVRVSELLWRGLFLSCQRGWGHCCCWY